MARRRLPVYLRDKELSRLLDAVPNQRDRLIVLVGAYAGLRVSEILNLRIGDLDFEDGMLEVRVGKGDKDRTIPMHVLLARALRVHIGSAQAGWLFPSGRSGSGHLMRRAVQLMIHSAAERAGIVRHVTPHKLRHTFASNLLFAGADLLEIKDLLGHASVSTTQSYAFCRPERLREAVDRL